MTKSKYEPLVIEIVSKRGCVKKEVIAKYVAMKANIPPEELENFSDGILSRLLKSMVKKGYIRRKSTGYYCID
jgi:DNA-binding HxlR family transcriptional regulator